MGLDQFDDETCFCRQRHVSHIVQLGLTVVGDRVVFMNLGMDDEHVKNNTYKQYCWSAPK